MFAGETGRVLLSELPDEDLQGYLNAAVEAGMDMESLRNDIDTIKDQHYFIGVGLRTPGVGTISVPIQGPAGILGALTISGPADRWSLPVMEAAVPKILRILAPTSALLAAVS